MGHECLAVVAGGSAVATPRVLDAIEAGRGAVAADIDGNGYPDGLAGNDIPLGSRLIMIADTYDAICSERPYRKALPSEAALEIIQKGAGTQFDPNLVPIFESTYKEFPCATTTSSLPQ